MRRPNMKRDRNSFFSNYTAQNTSFIPNMQPPFINEQTQQMPDMNGYNDIDNRLNKLERMVNRLESRVSKLENLNSQTPTTNNYSNMYML